MIKAIEVIAHSEKGVSAIQNWKKTLDKDKRVKIKEVENQELYSVRLVPNDFATKFCFSNIPEAAEQIITEMFVSSLKAQSITDNDFSIGVLK